MDINKILKGKGTSNNVLKNCLGKDVGSKNFLGFGEKKETQEQRHERYKREDSNDNARYERERANRNARWEREDSNTLARYEREDRMQAAREARMRKR